MLPAHPTMHQPDTLNQPSVSGSSTWRGVVDTLALTGLLAIATALLRFSVALPAPAATGALTPPELENCLQDPDGYLVGELYGDLARQIDWSGPALKCGGMLRPDGAGMRLLFGPADDPAPLLFVIGLDVGPEAANGVELPANLTIIDQGGGRFFNSGPGERCWVTASEVRQAGEPEARSFTLSGELYCAGALAAVNGSGYVTPGDFRFSGRVSVDAN